ncbi:MAG: hypothetical protein L0211_16025 [Planctomycetaceae bacterium]|nr:hypothetical protein [Planctomycetaceae bacterium]
MPLPETQFVNAPSGLEEECEAMKGDSPDAIPHQIQGSIVADIDVVGGEVVCAKIEQWEEHDRRDDNHYDGPTAAIFHLTFHAPDCSRRGGAIPAPERSLGIREGVFGVTAAVALCFETSLFLRQPSFGGSQPAREPSLVIGVGWIGELLFAPRNTLL